MLALIPLIVGFIRSWRAGLQFQGLLAFVAVSAGPPSNTQCHGGCSGHGPARSLGKISTHRRVTSRSLGILNRFYGSWMFHLCGAASGYSGRSCLPTVAPSSPGALASQWPHLVAHVSFAFLAPPIGTAALGHRQRPRIRRGRLMAAFALGHCSAIVTGRTLAVEFALCWPGAAREPLHLVESEPAGQSSSWPNKVIG